MSLLSLNCGTCEKPGAKYRCGRCNIVSYCNSECQLSAWPKHKVTCNRRLINVVIATGDHAYDGKMNEKEFSDIHDWKPCRVPMMLGIPLQMKRLPGSSTVKQLMSKLTPGSVHPENLQIARVLMIDPESGLVAPESQVDSYEAIAFARSDKVNFDKKIFWHLQGYMNYLTSFYFDENFDYESFKATKLTESAFQEFNQRQSNDKIISSNRVSKKIEIKASI